MLNSHTTVASIGKPMAILNFSIHAPGLGRNFSHAGFQLNKTYGEARPRPTDRKIKTMMRRALRESEAERGRKKRRGAGRRQGRGEHAVEKCAGRAVLARRDSPAASRARPPSVTSKTPNKFSATSVTSVVRQTMKMGLPNCIPQPA